MKSQKFIFLDTQTTGMRPPRGALLEIAWTIASAEDHEFQIHSHLAQLPDGHSISKQVQEITGLTEPHQGRPLTEIGQELRHAIQCLDKDAVAAIHYAQFEKPFLKELLAEDFEKLQVLCTQQLAKLLLPDLPSPNIRAVTGYFGQPLTGLNRAAPFVNATVHIWRGLCELLQPHGIQNFLELQEWMQKSEKPKPNRYAYRIEQLERLSLPDRPGVYRMLTKTGEILYVGKATSLKDRVNSYFRGKKGRDRKKLEMLAQVWNFKITETRSALEAAVLESDEIKRHSPRYNNLLKGGRQIVFYDRDLATRSFAYSKTFRLGPFREHSLIESLRLIQISLESETFEMIFYQPIEDATMQEGWRMFAQAQGLALHPPPSCRQLLALAIKLFRRLGTPEPKVKATIDPSAEPLEDAPLTAEELAAKFERLFRRAGAEYARARLMTRLLNCQIEYETGGQSLSLFLQNGQVQLESNKKTQTVAWDGLGLETYDRISILLNELSRYPHRIKSSIQAKTL